MDELERKLFKMGYKKRNGMIFNMYSFFTSKHEEKH